MSDWKFGASLTILSMLIILNSYFVGGIKDAMIMYFEVGAGVMIGSLVNSKTTGLSKRDALIFSVFVFFIWLPVSIYYIIKDYHSSKAA